MKKRVLVIYNPCSGSDVSRKGAKHFRSSFPPDRFDLTIIKTQGKNDAKRIAFDNKDNFDLIVSAGGDGTFNEVINGIMPDLVPIAYYPNGTTNDTAKTLGISTMLEDTVSLIENEYISSIDVGKINDRFFFCTASFGFGSNASLKTKQSLKNILGHFAYIVSGIKNAGDIKPVKMKISLDNETLNGEFVFGAVINTISVGGIFNTSENNFKLNDGEFEVVLVPKINSMVEIPKLLALLKHQKFDNHHIIFKKCKTISFESNRKIPWLVDGEHGGESDCISVQVIKRGLLVYAPQNNQYL